MRASGRHVEPTPTRERLRDAMLFVPVVGFAIYIAGSTIAYAVHDHLPYPYLDQWLFLLPTELLDDLGAQHNEHRPIVGRLLSLVDSLAFDGQGHFLLASTIASLFATATLVSMATARGPRGRGALLPMLALTVAVLLSAYTWDAFLFPLQASYVGVCTAAAGAFLLATGRELSPGRIVGVAALSLLATYSIGSGLLVPLLVLLVGVLRGLSKRRVIALGGIAAAAFATYFATFEMPVYDLPFDEAPSGVVDVLAYSLVFLGGPLSLPWEATRVTAATVIGGVGIALLAIVLITRMRQPRRVDPADWALPAVAVFAVGSAGLAAVGRAPLGLASALEPRYGSPAMLLWCALFGEGMRAHRRTVARPALAFGAGALSLYLATLQDDLEERGRQALRRFPEAESALLAGALDAHVVAGTTLPHYVTERIAALRRERLSVFAEPWASWYGRPIADYRTPAAAGACIGYLGAVTPVISYAAPAFRARGWAFDLRRGEPVARLVLVDDQGRVVGYAIGGRPRPDVEKVMPNVTSRTTGFVGHLGKLERDEVRVRALALVQGDEVCPLEPELTVRMADAAALVIPESEMP